MLHTEVSHDKAAPSIISIFAATFHTLPLEIYSTL